MMQIYKTFIKTVYINSKKDIYNIFEGVSYIKRFMKLHGMSWVLII